jgi:DNA-binding transcriptional LysR family regulator
MLDLRRLTAFREVAAARSFSVAAERLDYTQSTISQQVASLERELRTTLLDRTARPVRLTPAGRLVLRRAEDLIGNAEAIERELNALAGGRAGLLRVGGFSTAWATFLPPAIAAYGHEHPEVRLELDELEPGPGADALLNGRLDVVVVYLFEDRRPELDPRLERVHLLDDPYAIALPRDHRLARRAALGLEDLAEDRWLSPPAGEPYSEALRDLLRDEGGFTPQFHETRDIAMAQPLIAAGLAVGMLPALNLLQPHAGVVVRSLPAAGLARSVFALRLARHDSVATDRMVAALTEAAGQAAGAIAEGFG